MPAAVPVSNVAILRESLISKLNILIQRLAAGSAKLNPSHPLMLIDTLVVKC